jgi:hypothetical protein
MGTGGFFPGDKAAGKRKKREKATGSQWFLARGVFPFFLP